MKNKEWLNVNQYRYFPFKEELPLLGTKYILDINFLIPTIYRLPLKVTQIRTFQSLFTLVIKDSDNKFIGIFSSLDSNMTPASSGCSGRITYSEEISIEFTSEQIQDVNIEIELSTVKLSDPYLVPYLDINGTQLKGDIIIEESEGYTLNVNEIDSVTDELVINSTNQYLPKCVQDSPILSINGITPDSNGNIDLVSISPHIEIAELDTQRIVLTSDLNSVDFDKHSLTDAMGPIGEQGTPGRDGIDGRNAAYPVTVIQPYGGGFLYNEDRFVTKSIDADILVEHLGIISAYSSKSTYYWENIKPEIRAAQYVRKELSGVPLGVVSAGGNLYVYESNGYLTTNGVREHIADSISSFSASDTDYALIEGDILRFKNGMSYQMPALYRVKYIDNVLHILFSNGRYQIWDKIIYQLSDSRKMLDTNGEWIIGEQGMLYRILGFPKDYSNNVGIYEDLNSIDSEYIVGNGGIVLRFVNNKFQRIPTPTNKNWESVLEISSGAWIMGGY